MKSTTQYVFVIRHGQTIPNLLLEQASDSFFYEVTGSDETIGLTSLGFVQAEEAAQFLASFLNGARLAKLFCSQFLRTRSTAQVIQSILPDKPAIVEDRRVAKRHYGDFWNITYAGVQALYPQEYLNFTREGGYYYRPPKGENYVDLKKRLLAFVRSEIDSTDGHVCICTHSATALMLEQLLAGEMTDHELVARYDAIAVPNASVVVYKRIRGTRRMFGARLAVVGWLKRLSGVRQPNWEKVRTFNPSALPQPSTISLLADLPDQLGVIIADDSIIDRENRVA